MAEKAKSTKTRKSAGATKSVAKKKPKRTRANKSSQPKTPAYFVAHDFDFGIFIARPRSARMVIEFDSFQAAKEQAVNDLIEVIEDCERKLWEIQRAGNYEQLLEISTDGAR